MMNLAQLLAGSLADILAREAGNGTGLYLYRTDKAWVAFESSAYRLKRTRPPRRWTRRNSMPGTPA